MAFWNFIGGTEDAEKEKQEKNAERIQDFINKFDIQSRELKTPAKTNDEQDTAAWQGYDWVKKATATSDDRSIRVKDYREMVKKVPEIAQGVKIYADNGTQYNISNRVLEIESPNNKIVEILERLFFENLDMNSTLWKAFYNMCKLGDEFYEVIVDNPAKPNHIVSLERIKKPENIERIEENGQLKSFVYYYNDQEKKPREFQPWQIIHFRIEEEETDPYGRSVLESGRDTFKKLSLMEDAMLIYRITRAPERRVFYIDVGQLSTKEANKYISQVKRQFRKKQFIDSNTGEIAEKANPMSTSEDFFIGVRANSNGTRIETLPAGCLTLDTKIDSLDGNSYSLSEMIEQYKNGVEQWVYSTNPETGEIAPGLVSWAGVTRKNSEIMEVELDNGEVVRCTPDHKFPVWGKGHVEAKDLKENDSIIAHNKKLSSKEDGDRIEGYEKIYDHDKKDFIYTHQMVANYLKETDKYNEFIYEKKEKLTTIHHFDFNKYNNMPNNLFWMGNKDHFKYHSDNCGEWNNGYRIWWDNITEEKKAEFIKKTEYGRNKGREVYHNKLKNDIEFRNKVTEKQSESAKKYIDSLTKEEREERKQNSINNWVIANQKFNEKMNLDPEFRKQILEKRSESISKTLDSEYHKNRIIENNKQMWSDSEHYEKVFGNSYIKFDEVLLTKFIDIFNEQENYTKTLEWINENSNNEFTKYLVELNESNTGKFNPYKLTSRFTKRFLENYGFENARDFSNKVELRNHRVVAIRMLDYTEDVGTLTIDKEEKYHDYHTFALSCGIYIFNSNLGEVDDVKFFRDKILKTLGIPIGYLGGASEGGVAYDPKSYLSNQEIQFARTIERLQKFVIRSLEKVALIELALSDVSVKDIRKFKIKLTPPSNVDQLMEIEIRNQQFALVQSIKGLESFLPDEWIYKNVLGLNDQEINNIRLQLQMEQQMQLQMQQAGEGGGGGMDMSSGGALGGNIAGGPAPAVAGGPEMGGEMGGGEGGGEEAAGGGEAGLEVASRDFIEFDGGHWLVENKKDIEKLIKYVKLYEKVHKDNKRSKDIYENSLTRMTIKGEFRGLLKASKNSQISRTPSKMLVEKTKH